MTQKFKQYTNNMSIIVKNALMKANHSISMIKRYHIPL